MTELTEAQKKRLIDAYLEFERQIEARRSQVHKLLTASMKQLDQIKIDSLINSLKDNNL